MVYMLNQMNSMPSREFIGTFFFSQKMIDWTIYWQFMWTINVMCYDIRKQPVTISNIFFKFSNSKVEINVWFSCDFYLWID